MKIYGAYVHARPDGRIFYVGKGMERRARNLRCDLRNGHHANIVAKHGSANIAVGFIPCSSESIALELEKGLIKCLRRSGVQLVNKTDGGEGSSGYIHTDESRAKLRYTSSRTMSNPENRERIAATLRGRKLSADHRAAISAGLVGNSNTKGKPISKEHLDALRASNIGRTCNADKRAKISAKNKGSKRTPETRLKMREKALGRPSVLRGRIYVHKTGTKCRMICEADVAQFVRDGWIIGRGNKNGW